ncbi:MAG: hypothetical protein R6U31_02550 [bacterium]
MIIRKTLILLIISVIAFTIIFSSSLSVNGIIKECSEDSDGICYVNFISLDAVSRNDTCYMTINSEIPDTGDCRQMKITEYILKACTLSAMDYTDTSVTVRWDTLNFDSTGLKNIMFFCDSVMYEFIISDFSFNYPDSSCGPE